MTKTWKNKKYRKYKKKKTIKKRIKKKLGGETIKILVYCHEYKIEYNPENKPDSKFVYYDNITRNTYPYKLSQTLELLVSKHGWNNKNIIVETVDIVNEPTYKRDGFDQSFIDEHLNEYDLVYVPDCGGLWIYLQTNHYHDQWDNQTQALINAYNKMNISEEEKQLYINDRLNKPVPPIKNLNTLIELIQSIGKMVKPNGVLFCSKFSELVNPNDVHYIMENLNLVGFNLKTIPIEQLDSYCKKMYIYAIKEE